MSCATNLRSLRSRLEFKVFNATKDWTGRFHYEVAGVRVETTIILEWMKKINGLLGHIRRHKCRCAMFSCIVGIFFCCISNKMEEGDDTSYGSAPSRLHTRSDVGMSVARAWTRLEILRRNFPAISLEIT